MYWLQRLVSMFSPCFLFYTRECENEDAEAEHPSREMCIFPNCTRFVTHFYSVEIKHSFNKVSPSFTQQIDRYTHTNSSQDSDISKSLLFYFFQSHQQFFLSKTSRVQNNLHESQSYINLFYISVLHFFFK